MASPHAHKYEFDPPRTIKDAKDRLRSLLIDILNIEKQLAPRERRGLDGNPMPRSEYRSWRSRTHASLVFKRVEQSDLKAWILQRRREIEAAEVSINDPDDPRAILIGVRTLLRDLLDKDVDHPDLGQVYNVVEQHLQHVL